MFRDVNEFGVHGFHLDSVQLYDKKPWFLIWKPILRQFLCLHDNRSVQEHNSVFSLSSPREAKHFLFILEWDTFWIQQKIDQYENSFVLTDISHTFENLEFKQVHAFIPFVFPSVGRQLAAHVRLKKNSFAAGPWHWRTAVSHVMYTTATRGSVSKSHWWVWNFGVCLCR